MRECRICKRNAPSVGSTRYANEQTRGLCHHCIKREHWRTGKCECFRKPAAEPDPQRDGGLPWIRADEEQMSAIADYNEGQLKGDA